MYRLCGKVTTVSHVPGQKLTDMGQHIECGPGTYERDGAVYSTLSGYVDIQDSGDGVSSSTKVRQHDTCSNAMNQFLVSYNYHPLKGPHSAELWFYVGTKKFG